MWSTCGDVDHRPALTRRGCIAAGGEVALDRAVVAARAGPNDLLNYAIAENVRRQVARLDASPPIVQKLRREEKVDIVGGVYDIATGIVTAA